MKYLALATVLASLSLPSSVVSEGAFESRRPSPLPSQLPPPPPNAPNGDGPRPSPSPTPFPQNDYGFGYSAISGGGGGSGSGDSRIGFNDGRYRQNTEVQRDDNRIAYSSSERNSTLKTRLDMGFRTDPVPSFGVRFFNGYQDAVNKCGFRVDFVRLVEYNDTIDPRNSSSRLDFGLVPKDLWTSLKTGGVTNRVVNGANVKTISSSLTFPTSRPLLRQVYGELNVTVSLDITDAPVTTASGQMLSPFGIKYSVYIDNWVPKFQNSKLLFIKALFSKDDKMSQSGTRNVTLADGCGNFNWNGTVLNGNVAQSVLLNGTLQSDADGIVPPRPAPDNSGDDDNKFEGSRPKLLMFQLPMGSHLAWDPTIQADSSVVTGSSTSDATAVTASLIFASLASVFALLL